MLGKGQQKLTWGHPGITILFLKSYRAGIPSKTFNCSNATTPRFLLWGIINKTENLHQKVMHTHASSRYFSLEDDWWVNQVQQEHWNKNISNPSLHIHVSYTCTPCQCWLHKQSSCFPLACTLNSFRKRLCRYQNYQQRPIVPWKRRLVPLSVTSVTTTKSSLAHSLTPGRFSRECVPAHESE
jgi:hypothetical protein